ncbi:MAG: TetR/AcrR family transcriptional regulator [Balneolaceae bacterium]|nr:MAG: TetR/AcrR family transcriptional regulator [Balneolaceae bacterium]
MQKLTRKEREKIARKEHILDIAEEIIAERGFDGATMDEIAEKAEVGKGTLYLHFKSKSAIYLGICERGSKLLTQEMAKVLLLEVSGMELIEKIGDVYLQFVRKNPVYFHAFNYYESLLNDEIIAKSDLVDRCEKSAKEAMTYIVRALQIGMQDGSIKSTFEPHELALIIWGASKGVVNMSFSKQKRNHMKILDDVNFSLDTLIHSLINLFAFGMKNDQQSQK